MYIMPCILLVLETEHDIDRVVFLSSRDLEEYLNTINQKDYLRKNILFYINDEYDDDISKIYKRRYLKN